MSTINDTDLLLVERNGVQYQITYDQMSTLNDDDLLLVERGGVQYKVEAQDISTGPNGLIIPPVEVLTPVNGAGITEFTSYEPVSSAITVVGEAGTIAKSTDNILSVADGSTGVVDFDGNDLLTVPSFTTAPQGTNNWTIEFYAYFDFGSNSSSKTVTWTGETSHPNYRIAVQVENGKYYLVDSGNYGGSWYSSKNDLASYTSVVAPSNKWHHVAIQRASGVDTIYIDGQVQFTASGHTGSSPSVTGNWIIGGGQAGSNHMIGKLSNFRVLSGTALYSSTFTPPATPLTNITNTVLLCCQSGSSATAAAVSTGTLTTTGDPTATSDNVTGQKVLSFPTNTNFSGLSVGDVAQAGLELNGTASVTQGYTFTDGRGNLDNLFNGVVTGNGTLGADYNANLVQPNDAGGLPCTLTFDPPLSARSGTLKAYVTRYSAGTVNYTINGSVGHSVYAASSPVEDDTGVTSISTFTFDSTTGNAQLWGFSDGEGVLQHVDNVNITAIDASAPSQTTEYATLNSSDKHGSITLSNGNLSFSHTGSNVGVRATKGISSGKYYWEVTNTSAGNGNFTAGIANSSWNLTYVGANNGYGFASQSGFYPASGTNANVNANTTGDVVGFAFDADAGTLETYVNGVIQYSAAGWGTIPSGTWYPAFGSGANGTQTVNFGATAFTHTPPSGYAELSETVTTYPSVTVDGGDWDASNQSQVWSSQAIGGSLGSVDIAFNGEVPSLGSSPSGGNYSAPMTFEPTAFSTPGSVNSLVIYGARNAGSPRYIKVDGVIVPFTDNNTFQELTVNVTSFSSIVCEHNGTDGSVIAAIYVNGKLLVDAVEDSQVWTNSSSFTTGTLQAGQLSYAFDGDTSTVLESGVGGVWEVNFSTPLSGEVVVWNTQAAASRKWHVYVDGVDNAFDITPAVGYQTLGTFTNITKITQTSDHNGAGWGTSVAAIKIGGKLLIDAGIRDFGDRYLGSSISYEKSLTFTDDTQLANMVGPFEMTDANGDVVTPVSDTIASVSGNVLTLQGDTNLAYFQPGDEVQTGVEIVSVDAAAPSITVDGGSWLGADGSGSTYKISKSLRFNSSDSAYLSRDVSTPGNRRTWTWSGWIKKNVGQTGGFFCSGTNNGAINYIALAYNNADTITVVDYTGGFNYFLETTSVYRDPSTWYHIVVAFDSTQSTNSDRIKIYVNGIKQTAVGTPTWPSPNFEGNINATDTMGLGTSYANTGNYDGYLADVHFVDGQALTPTAFGDFDDNNVWQAKAASISSYGTNGFHLDFSDSSSDAALGYDAAGSNNWTVNNLSVAPGADNDSLVDTPTNYGDDTGAGGEVRGNYATLNPLFKNANLSPTNGNLDILGTGASHRPIASTIGVSSGLWYWEVTVTSYGSGGVGLMTNSSSIADGQYLGNSGSVGWFGNTTYNNGASASYGSGFSAGDVIGVAFDATNGTLVYYQNGTSLGTAFTDLTSGPYFPAVSTYNTSDSYTLNSGQRPFAYAAPSGYKALTTANLPEPSIKDGSDHFDVVTYTGNGSTQTISGLEFSPDLVWLKSSSSALNHRLVDSVQGVTSTLSSNLTYAKHDSSSEFTALTDDGFSVTQGNSFVLNNSSTDYVAWCWNAGDTTETIAAGDLNSSIYDDSQVWSNWSAETGSLYLDGRRVSAFNNDFTNIGPGSQTHVIQWNGSIAWTNKIEIIVANQASVSQSGNKGPWFFEFTHAGGTLTVNSSNWTGHNSTDAEIGAGTIPFYDFTSQLVSPLTRIRIHGGAGSHQAIGIGAIKTDGKLLVDYGVSVDAVPAIASEVRANPAAGFSIVSWDAAANATVAHGLSKAPSMIIAKSRTLGYNWAVYHENLGADYYLQLNTTSAKIPWTNYWGTVNSQTFSGNVPTNFYNNSGEMVAYCFAPVEGHSQMSSWTGNGSTDGPFVFTGFKISFLLYKRTDVDSNWYIMDTERDPDNPTTQRLLAESSAAEYTYSSTDLLDVNANGFKVRSSNNAINANGGTYIYYAVAENPFNTTPEVDGTGDTQVALDALVAAATEIVETDGTTMYLNGATGPWRTGLSIEGSQINAAAPGPSEITFTSQNQGTPAFSGVDATLASRTWTLESGTTATGPWTAVDTYVDYSVLGTQTGATPWTENKPTLQPNTFYRIKVQYDSTNAPSVESVYNTFKTGDA